MLTKTFSYQVRTVEGGVTRLVAYYDADAAQRPAAVLIHTDALPVGTDVDLQFVVQPATNTEIVGEMTHG